MFKKSVKTLAKQFHQKCIQKKNYVQKKLCPKSVQKLLRNNSTENLNKKKLCAKKLLPKSVQKKPQTKQFHQKCKQKKKAI